MRYKLQLLILLAILIVPVVTIRATDLRGRLDSLEPSTQMVSPVPGVSVTLFSPQSDGKFTIIAQAVTGPDGTYYFRGIYAGQYVLQIAGVNYPLAVGTMPTQDIPVIRK